MAGWLKSILDPYRMWEDREKLYMTIGFLIDFEKKCPLGILVIHEEAWRKLSFKSVVLRLKNHRLTSAKTIGSDSSQGEDYSHRTTIAQDGDIDVRLDDFSPPGASHGQISGSVQSQLVVTL